MKNSTSVEYFKHGLRKKSVDRIRMQLLLSEERTCIEGNRASQLVPMTNATALTLFFTERKTFFNQPQRGGD